MARKSYGDLMRQINRVMENNRGASMKRRNQAYDAFYKIASSMARSKTMARDYARAKREFENFIGVNRGDDFEQKRNLYADEKSMSRVYSTTKHAQYARIQRAQGLNGG